MTSLLPAVCVSAMNPLNSQPGAEIVIVSAPDDVGLNRKSLQGPRSSVKALSSTIVVSIVVATPPALGMATTMSWAYEVTRALTPAHVDLAVVGVRPSLASFPLNGSQ